MSIEKFLRDERKKYNLKGLIMAISADIEYVNVKYSGKSMDSLVIVPDMHYRIGGQSITIYTTLFLILADKNILNPRHHVSRYLDKVPNSDKITLLMLCNMTSNLPDYIDTPYFSEIVTNNVFKQWKHEELLDMIYRLVPLDFEPGTKFNFAHMTNIFILCTVIELVTKKDMMELLNKYIFKPLNLNHTMYSLAQDMIQPVFHSYTNERIDNYEDSTYWNPSWGYYATSIVSNANDINVIVRAIGSGTILTDATYGLLMGHPKKIPITNPYYGMGLIVGGYGLNHLKTDDYPYTIITNSESFAGYNGIWAYIPSSDITINFQTNTFDKNFGISANNILQDLFETFTIDQLSELIKKD